MKWIPPVPSNRSSLTNFRIEQFPICFFLWYFCSSLSFLPFFYSDTLSTAFIPPLLLLYYLLSFIFTAFLSSNSQSSLCLFCYSLPSFFPLNPKLPSLFNISFLLSFRCFFVPHSLFSQ